jgi:hypothetical protein
MVSRKTQKAGMKLCRKYYLLFRTKNNKWITMDKNKITKNITIKSLSEDEIKKIKKMKWKLSTESKYSSHRMMPSWLKTIIFESGSQDKRYFKTSGISQEKCYYAIPKNNDTIDTLITEFKPSILKKTKKRNQWRWSKRTKRIRYAEKDRIYKLSPKKYSPRNNSPRISTRKTKSTQKPDFEY